MVTLGLLFVSCFGKASLVVIGGPLLFLCLMVPVTESVLELAMLGLQHFFSYITGLLAPLIHDNYVGRDRFMLRFADSEKPLFIISEECSGLRSMMGMVILAWYFSMVYRLSLRKIVTTLLTATALALALNLIRIVLTIELHLRHLQTYAEGRWHGLLGIFLCLIGFVLLSKLAKKIQD